MRKSRMSRKPNGNVRTRFFDLKGGLNLIGAPITIPEGMVLSATNYELLSSNGYRRILGFERFDGQASPSESSYWILNFDTGDILEPEIGGTVEGATSGAKGEVGLVVASSGTWPGGDAAGYLVIFQISGAFQDNEVINFLGLDDGFSGAFSSAFG